MLSQNACALHVNIVCVEESQHEWDLENESDKKEYALMR